MNNSSKNKLFILLIFLLAFIFRIYNLNWDSNNHLHPDERFLTMVTTDIKIPSSLPEYFNTASSPLNPYNYPSYQFFVYGTFPLFLTKILTVYLHLDNYNQIVLFGRLLSALFDSANVILLYFISKKILKSYYKFLPSLFYSFLALPLQLSHFYAVDTFLNFFILLTFMALSYRLFFPAFIAFGLALSCKISALYFVPIIFLFVFRQFLTTKIKSKFILKIFIAFLFTFITFRIFQPYSFTGLIIPNPQFINSLKTLSGYSKPNIFYPPGVQWTNRLPLLNATKNTFIWGFGIVFSFTLLLLSIRYIPKLKIKFDLVFIISTWVIFLFFYQSIQFVHTMRYLLPIYPFLCLIFTYLLSQLKVKKSLVLILLFLNLLTAFAFLSIYSRPNSRVQASNWIINNISQDKIISSEYWDDALPLNSSYQSIPLSLFDPDSDLKWATINQSLNSLDYLILSSNRLWASIPRVPTQYPLTSKFYSDLFSERLNFTKIKEFNSYPGFNLSFLKSCYYFGPTNYPGVKNSYFSVEKNCDYPGIYFRDDTAEEAFSVYDHPKVIIFQKK